MENIDVRKMCYDDIPLIFFEHPLVFGFDHGGTNGGFFHVRKTQLFEGAAHRVDTHTFKVGNKRRRKADYYRIAALQQYPRFFGAVNDLFCVLGANNKAAAA